MFVVLCFNVAIFNSSVYPNSGVQPNSRDRMLHERWTTSLGSFWNEQQWLTGDFNGDGKDDMVKVFNEDGEASIEVYLASNGDFTLQRWATRQGGYWNEQQWRVGDFNGDGKDDLVNVFAESGKVSMEVHLAGNGGFALQRWATGQGRYWNEQQWRVGDFNGDGKDDMAKAFEDGGKACIDVHLAGNGEFTPQRWATGPGRFWNEQQWRAGDFNGDGKDDMAKVFQEGGKANIDIYLSKY